MVIHKYPLKFKEVQEIKVPHNFQFLSIQNQNNVPVIWLLVSQEASLFPATIQMIPTGQNCNVEHKDYLGTVQFGDTVFHFFISQ